MRALAEFTKTTLMGGVLIIMPIYLTVLLLLKALAGVVHLVSPITHELPPTMQFPELIAIAMIILVCFVSGIALRTGPGLRAKNALERSLLEKIPGYTLIRGLAGRLAGQKDEETFSVVLVEIEDALVPAFLVEDCGDGHCVVFVPSVPTPAAGTIYIIQNERVHPVDVPFTQAVGVITRWGSGAKALLEGMRRAEVV